MPARTRNSRRDKAAAALDRVGLGDRLHHRPTELLGGATATRRHRPRARQLPKVLFADEPTGALDSRTSIELLALLRSSIARADDCHRHP